jgi:hypothetical protein
MDTPLCFRTLTGSRVFAVGLAVALVGCGGGSAGGESAPASAAGTSGGAPAAPVATTPTPTPAPTPTPVSATSGSSDDAVFSATSYVRSGVNKTRLTGTWMMVGSGTETFTHDGKKFQIEYRFRKLFYLADMISGMVKVTSCEIDEQVSATGNTLKFSEDSVDYAMTLGTDLSRLTGTATESSAILSTSNYQEKITFDMVKLRDSSDFLSASGVLKAVDGSSSDSVTATSVICLHDKKGTTQQFVNGVQTSKTSDQYVQALIKGASGTHAYFETGFENAIATDIEVSLNPGGLTSLSVPSSLKNSVGARAYASVANDVISLSITPAVRRFAVDASFSSPSENQSGSIQGLSVTLP